MTVQSFDIQSSKNNEFIQFAHTLGLAAKSNSRFQALGSNSIGTTQNAKLGIFEKIGRLVGLSKKEHTRYDQLEKVMTKFYERAITLLNQPRAMTPEKRAGFLKDLLAIDGRMHKIRAHHFTPAFKKLQLQLEVQVALKQNQALGKQTMSLYKEVTAKTRLSADRRENVGEVRKKILSALKKEDKFLQSCKDTGTIPSQQMKSQQKMRMELLVLSYVSTFPSHQDRPAFTERELASLHKLREGSVALQTHIKRINSNKGQYNTVKNQLRTVLTSIGDDLQRQGQWSHTLSGASGGDVNRVKGHLHRLFA